MATVKPTPADAPTWEHRGRTITLDERGTFHTKVNNKHISGPSLDSLKKRINELDDVQPEPFEALELNFHLSNGKRPEIGIRTVSVRSVEKGGRSKYDRAGFIGEAKPKKAYHRKGDAESFTVLHPNTPECREAYKAYMDALVETARIEEERNKIVRYLFQKIPRYEIGTFLENGNRLVAEYLKDD